MKNLYDQFVELCLQLCLDDDYLEKRNIKKHNRAMDELFKLRDYMQGMDCSATIHALLDHEDERVRMCAASFCVDWGMELERAIVILETLERTSKDKSISFSARMARLVHTGQWPPATTNPTRDLQR